MASPVFVVSPNPLKPTRLRSKGESLVTAPGAWSFCVKILTCHQTETGLSR
jgi:hypothetical protein